MEWNFSALTKRVLKLGFPCPHKKAKTYLNISVASTAEVVVLVKRVRGALCKEGGGI
jgi:hypothetical protein